MDQGLYDATGPVTFYGLTNRMALSQAQKVLVRWVTPTVRVGSKRAWACSVIMDGDTRNKQALSFDSAGDNPAAAHFTSSAVEATAATYANSFDMQTLASGSVQASGRFAQFEISDAVAQPLEIEALSLEFNTFGRRG
jgi:hypothetical protein